jgi:hypothetical protein
MPAPYFDLDLQTAVRKLDLLSRDLNGIRSGVMPSSETLGEMPLLDEWDIRFIQCPILVGKVSGHPKISDGPVLTTDLWLIHDGLKWARTYSRFYRLGEFVGDVRLLKR